MTDNAPVMRSAVRSLQNRLHESEQLPIIGHACSAHWLQLVLGDLSAPPDSSALNEDSFGVRHIKKAWDLCANIRKVFSLSKLAIAALRSGASASAMSRQMRLRSIVAPCVTRWSTVLNSAVSILKMQAGILIALDEIRAKDSSILSPLEESTIRREDFGLVHDVVVRKPDNKIITYKYLCVHVFSNIYSNSCRFR